MKKHFENWRDYLTEEEVRDELFKVDMEVSFPNTRDVELETFYNLLRAVPSVTRVNAEKSQKKATNIYIQLEIKVNKMVIGKKTPMQYLKDVLIPDIYRYAKGDYRPTIIPYSTKIVPQKQKKIGRAR